ncbi:MAG: lysine--tRNA ligase [Leptospiraceae bacterium]|nr:lysine--tRNA ligase [Leptospiraceae bacterium]
MAQTGSETPAEVSVGALEAQRLSKLEAIKSRGIDPYPVRFAGKQNIADIRRESFGENNDLTPAEDAAHVATAGRVVAIRDMGKAQFLQIQDQSGRVQVYAGNKTLGEDDYFVLRNLDLGDIIGIKGRPFRTKTGEASIHADELKILSKNLAPLPVVKEKDGETYDGISDIELRYRQRYIDLAVNAEARATFTLRSAILREIRDFLHRKGFMEVETPMMQAIASGAAARPFTTHHNALDIDLYMRIAPELYLKRLIVGGYEKVFEMNRNFRNEGISTKHNPEFTMIEIYQAYADYNTMMEITQDIFEHLSVTLLGSTEMPYGQHTISLKKPWKKIGYLESIKEATGLDFEKFLGEENPSVTEAKKMAASAGLKAEGLHTFWEVVDLAFSEKVEPNLIQPTIVMHYPKAISPLAKSIPGNEHLVERFEPYITGREMGNAFSELNDPLEQERRFNEQASQKASGAEETMETDDDFVTALKVGMPPTGGLGIGIDRLVMLFANKSSIKDVILFPLLRPNK